MTPLLIVKVNGYREPCQLTRDMETIAEGIRKGVLVCEVIAFDDAGRLAYPIKAEEVAAK